MLSFTGSVEAGRAVIRQSAANIIPVVLELGGKSPVILLPDANLDFAVPSAVHSNFVKSGQSCVAGSRILVHSSIYDEVCARVAEFAGKYPGRNAHGRGVADEHPDQQAPARATSTHWWRQPWLPARLGWPAAPRRPGNHWRAARSTSRPCSPTSRTTIPPLATEAFGPMASLLRFDTVDEALARANASEFGLSAQVWGNDAMAIQHLTQNLEAGAVWVNTYRAAHPTLPLGGMKTSGYGIEYGFEAVLEYTRPQVRHVGSHHRADSALHRLNARPGARTRRAGSATRRPTLSAESR